MIKVLVPGSFDPITKGHMNIIEQSSNLFDEVFVAVLKNSSKKNGFFTIEERMEIIRDLYQDRKNIQVVTGDVAVDLALSHECSSIVRGLRNTTDFEEEMLLAQINREISDNQINTICLFADNSLTTVSSSMVKEIFSLDKNISKYVDPIVEEKMLVKRRKL